MPANPYAEIARYYHLTHAGLTEDVAFMVAQVRRAGGPVLELGCGTGRLLLPIGRVGAAVVGLDSAAAMLAIARQTLQTTSGSLRRRIWLVQADMRHIGLAAGTFRLVIVPYNTLMHLDDAGLRATLRGVRSCLAPGGRLIIDVVNPHALVDTADAAEPVYEQTFTDPDTGDIVRQFSRHRLDGVRQRFYLEWIFEVTTLEGATRRVASTAAYAYRFPHQLQLFLEQTGFGLVHFKGDYDETPFDETSPRLILTAGRAPE